MIEKVAGIFGFLNRGFAMISPVVDLGIRLWIANIFFKSGLTKIKTWDSTVMLFEYEYEVPILSPTIAAFLGTAAELALPVLIAVGLAGRVSAFSLFVFNIVAAVSYPFLWTPDGAVGLAQHVTWGILLAVMVAHGPGMFSLDHLLAKKYQD